MQPHLIIPGPCPMTAPGFSLAIDKTVCIRQMKTVSKAVAVLMASYYVFGIEYPSRGAMTLEFIQRYNIVPCYSCFESCV